MYIAVMQKDDLEFLHRHAKRMKNGHILDHLLWCYDTMFEHACDANSSRIEFKPEILAAIKAAETPKGD